MTRTEKRLLEPRPTITSSKGCTFSGEPPTIRFTSLKLCRASGLRVDGHGLVDPEDVRRALRPGTALVSIMHANNEVGTIQPLFEIASIAHEHGALVHTDAAQTVGKIDVDVEAMGVDFLSVAGHKLYGPKDVGALFIREGIELEPLLHGAANEAGRRAGTENICRSLDWVPRATGPKRRSTNRPSLNCGIISGDPWKHLSVIGLY